MALVVAVLYGIYIYRKKKGRYEVHTTDMPGNELTKVTSVSQHVTTEDLDMNTAVIGNGEDELYGLGSNVTKGGGTNSEGEIYEDVKT
eukprot:353820_1